MSSRSSNAVLAKARAMYGKCLKKEDYRQLAECKSVPEVSNYLKTRTSYSKALRGLIDNEIHRGQLEPLLKQDIYLDVYALSRYTSDNAAAVTDFVFSRLETDQIVRCLVMLSIGKPEKFALELPLLLDDFTPLSLKKLAAVRSYDDLLAALEHTKYYAVISENRPPEGQPADVAKIEIALNNRIYSSAMDAISKMNDKTDQKELKDLFNSTFDFENLERILRLKKYHNFNAETVRSMLIPFGKLNKRVIDEFCAADNINDVYELARTTYLGKHLSKLQYYDNTQISDALINAYCKHHLRLSPNPTIVMISYLYLKQIEIHNVVNLIEATRYGMSSDEKLKLPVV